MKFGEIDNKALRVVVTQPANVPTPTEKAEDIDIPGRNSVLRKRQGAYLPVALTPSIWVPPTTDINLVRAWLMGEGDLTFAQGSRFFYKAWLSAGVEYIPQNFGGGYIASIPFEAYPFRYDRIDDTKTISASGGTITNPYPAYSEPEITINGSGDANITIGDTLFSIEGIVSGMVLDTELQEVYKGTALYNNRMIGAFPTLVPGVNAVTWEGGVTSIKINPRWRTI